jgi:hypothetical protein
MSRAAIRLSVTALFGLLPATLAAQSKFEGTITMTLSSPQGPMDVTFMFKGDRTRADMGMMGASMYMLHDASMTVMVLPSQRMYMEAPQMQMDQMKADVDTKAADFKMTGKKEKIAGYECEHGIVTASNGVQTDVCLAKGLGTFMMPMGPMGGRSAPQAWQKLGEYFPLKVQQVGSSDVSVIATRIERKSLEESLFELPSDFQKMDLGRMMRRPPR